MPESSLLENKNKQNLAVGLGSGENMHSLRVGDTELESVFMKGVCAKLKVNKADLRRQPSHEPSSLVTKDSPDDFEYEGANVSPDCAATITSSQTAPASASTSADGPKTTKQPYVKIDNPDDFE